MKTKMASKTTFKTKYVVLRKEDVKNDEKKPKDK